MLPWENRPFTVCCEVCVKVTKTTKGLFAMLMHIITRATEMKAGCHVLQVSAIWKTKSIFWWEWHVQLVQEVYANTTSCACFSKAASYQMM
jgi:hypothetical protein